MMVTMFLSIVAFCQVSTLTLNQVGPICSGEEAILTIDEIYIVEGTTIPIYLRV